MNKASLYNEHTSVFWGEFKTRTIFLALNLIKATKFSTITLGKAALYRQMLYHSYIQTPNPFT